MAYENTEVPVVRSQEQIRKLVMGNKGTGIMFWSRPPMEGFEAYVPVDGTTYHIRIQAEVKPLRRERDPEASVRRIWRVIFYHMKAVYENAASGVMEWREMILPYVVTGDGLTIAEHILPHIQKLSQQASGINTERLLPAPKEDAA